jgi:hypothetical protein
VDPEVGREILRFEGKASLGEEYASAFATEIRSRVMSDASRQVSGFLAGECRPFISVSIGETELNLLLEEPAAKEDRERREEFEKSLIRTEMVACLDVGERDPSGVLELFLSPAFRMVAESRIVDMWTDQEGSCLETKGVMGLVDPTRVCNRTSDYRAEGLAARHAQVVFNEGRSPYQEVYFKESLKTFVKVPGGLALHYINFTRAQSLGRIERWVGTGQIEDSQKENVKELLRVLSGGGGF